MPDSVTNARREDVDETLTCWGLSTGCLITTGAEGISDVLSVSYYDVYGNVIQTRSENLLGGVSSVSREYDFQGQCMSEEEKHIYNEDNVNTISRIHTYDRAGRLIETVTNLNGVEVVTTNAYDPIGRLEMTVVTNGEVSDTTMHTYNVRGWQTSIENDHWSAVMRYNNPIHSDSIASFTGNISEWEWSRGNETNAYSLSYDDLSRITGSRLFRNGTPSNALSEIGISYDSNGNILSLNRTGEDGSTVNDLVYNYDGNKLASLSDNSCPSQIYAYDADGNMTFDGRTGMSLDWNDLGLVEKVSLNGEDLVNYSYLADGTKVSALDSEGNGLLYLGSLIYRKQGENISLESAGFAGGRFVARETLPGVSSMVPMFHVTDHLGSVRAVVDGVSGEVVEINDYYPFGSRWNVAAGLKDDTNRFRYNSKEEQFRFGTPYIDYGARQYDPIIGRWFAQDPLSEKYYGISPYAFCHNNPINRIDADGRWDIKVSALDNRGKNPYAVMTVTNRNGSTIYKTVVRVTGRHRDRSASRGDTPVGKSRILEWRKTGNSRYPADSYGPNDLLALEYYEGEGIGRFGMHLHGGRSQSPDLKDTEGCIRISDEDIAELKVLTEELEASDPDEKKGTATVENDLPEPVKYSDREDVKYDWERYLGELEASFIIG